MYETGDLLVTLDKVTVWGGASMSSVPFRKELFTLSAGELVLYLGTQHPKGARMLHVLTTQSVGWIEYHHVVVILDANGEEIDLEEEQGLVGAALLRAKKAIDELTKGR